MRTFSPAVLARLPEYYQLFKGFHERGRGYVSSERLAGLLGVAPSLVRKDLLEVAVGVQKVGYHVPSTLHNIQEILGVRNTKQAFLVGVGPLGQALLGYRGFVEYGLSIIAAFDTDVNRVGQVIRSIEVFPGSRLSELIRRLQVKVGIITVPADRAQAVAAEMIEAGIVAIWNFAPMVLSVPEDILVRNENLGVGFSMLCYKLEKRLTCTIGE